LWLRRWMWSLLTCSTPTSPPCRRRHQLLHNSDAPTQLPLHDVPPLLICTGASLPGCISMPEHPPCTFCSSRQPCNSWSGSGSRSTSLRNRASSWGR
jgi:hypothetical protein